MINDQSSLLLEVEMAWASSLSTSSSVSDSDLNAALDSSPSGTSVTIGFEVALAAVYVTGFGEPEALGSKFVEPQKIFQIRWGSPNLKAEPQRRTSMNSNQIEFEPQNEFQDEF